MARSLGVEGFSPGTPTAAWHDDVPIRVGVSSCLIGQRVRWDGGHKRDRFACELLAPYVEWVSVCPEVELGLGVPRETLRLEEQAGATRLVTTQSGRDLSAAMRSFASQRLRALREDRLCGYLFKSKSPSCGPTGVKVRSAQGRPPRRGVGMFAESLVASAPWLPVEEEGRLGDPARRERFVERLFATHRLSSLFSNPWTPERLAVFHAAHRLQLVAHSRAGARRLDAVVETAASTSPDVLGDRYFAEFSAVLARPATRRRNLRVLEHLESRLRERLGPAERARLREAVESYRSGSAPRVDAIALVRRHVHRLEIATLVDQVYLEPYPAKLGV